MKHRAEIYRHEKKARIDIIDEIFSEIEKDIEQDFSYFQNSNDKLGIILHDIFIKEKAYRDPTLTRDTLMKRIDIGKDPFIKGFQYCFGMPFRECINRLRLKEAVILLEQSDLPIEKIAHKVGFGTIRTFQRQFVTIYNMSPKEYRKIQIK
ncbi:MAG: helix-turn-helix domain-containing protein [Dysgonomonas sp.]